MGTLFFQSLEKSGEERILLLPTATFCKGYKEDFLEVQEEPEDTNWSKGNSNLILGTSLHNDSRQTLEQIPQRVCNLECVWVRDDKTLSSMMLLSRSLQ